MGSFLPALTATAFRKFGFSTTNLVTDWAAIVGQELADATAPERLIWPRVAQHENETAGVKRPRTGATLVLRVDGAKALDVQYGARQILQRINTYFGCSAVANLRIVQAPPMVTRQSPPALRRPAEPRLGEVTGVADAGLRQALARLAGQVQAKR